MTMMYCQFRPSLVVKNVQFCSVSGGQIVDNNFISGFSFKVHFAFLILPLGHVFKVPNRLPPPPLGVRPNLSRQTLVEPGI